MNNSIRVLLILSLCLGLVPAISNTQEDGACSESAEKIAQTPELGYGRIARWMTRRLRSEYDDKAHWRDDEPGLSIIEAEAIEVEAKALEYAVMSRDCEVIQTIFCEIDYWHFLGLSSLSLDLHCNA